ncbi:MAG: SsrA-binding protein SmpB [Elusimicrobiaceae bacterium]|nr:SsrA-binding protein SmpB [Elusimicrobiaceae bacterium]
MPRKKSPGTVATNRKALFNYAVLETYEAGICLTGPEVKSVRLGNVTIEGSFARVDGDEVFLHNLSIRPYEFNHVQVLPPDRIRKLLLGRKEIDRLIGKTRIKGHTLVPLEIYFKNGWAKLKLALAQGKQHKDKRDSIKKREVERDMERAVRSRNR